MKSACAILADHDNDIDKPKGAGPWLFEDDDIKKEGQAISSSIAYPKNYVTVMDGVYQRAGVNNILNSGRRMVRAEHNAKEVLIPKISMTDLGDHTRSVGYKTNTVTYEFKSKTLN